jgi:heat-inducible transcriptional repressor
MVAAYVGEAAPVGSRTLSYLLPVKLSSASIRNTMAELMELGLIETPHASAGRVPTARGLRVFVDRLLDPRRLGAYEKRDLAGSVGESEPDLALRTASRLLSEHTRQLGFVLAPRLDRLVLRHVSLVRLSSDRVLAVLVARTGVAHRRVLHDEHAGGQADLERLAAALNERIAGRTLGAVRAILAGEVRALRRGADRLLRQVVELGLRALESEEREWGDLVLGTRLALLDQPEFHDPERIRQLFGVVEERETLLRVLDAMLAAPGVQVAFGEELGEPDLRRCALVVAPYGVRERPMGVLGVLGANRMDYARIIPLVDYVSQLLTEQLEA